jgi:phosphate acyltransferase
VSQNIVAVDTMGGDFAPDIVIEGLNFSSIRHPDVHFLLFGQESRVSPLLKKAPSLASRSTFFHCDTVISMDDKPTQALRKGQETSMWRAINAVRENKARVVVSAGNTGALMAIAKFQLRTLAGIDRPAIAALWPNLKSQSIVLDVGANIDADSKQLVDFCIMGAKYAQALLYKKRPLVGLLNIGTEALKGNEVVRATHNILKDLKDLDFEYQGFIEGNDISMGVVDVVVTDGYTGNIALKTAEGTARLVGTYLKNALSSSIMAKVGVLLAGTALEAFKDQIDPRNANGGVFLGLNGLVVKSHGGADGLGFSTATDLAINLASADILEGIIKDLNTLTFGKSVPEKVEA